MKCIIPCAGENSRMSYVPKHLVKISGKPLIAYIIDSWKDSVDGFIFVLKRSSTYMWEYLPENSAVVFQDVPMGLADAILRAAPYISGKFIIALGDCLYKGTFEPKEITLGIGAWAIDSPETKKNFLIKPSPITGLVEELIEKPQGLLSLGLCGMGIYFLDDRIFKYIRETRIVPSGGDFTEVLQNMIRCGEEISPVIFKGKYINIGSPEDLDKAEEILSGQEI